MKNSEKSLSGYSQIKEPTWYPGYKMGLGTESPFCHRACWMALGESLRQHNLPHRTYVTWMNWRRGTWWHKLFFAPLCQKSRIEISKYQNNYWITEQLWGRGGAQSRKDTLLKPYQEQAYLSPPGSSKGWAEGEKGRPQFSQLTNETG